MTFLVWPTLAILVVVVIVCGLCGVAREFVLGASVRTFSEGVDGRLGDSDGLFSALDLSRTVAFSGEG